MFEQRDTSGYLTQQCLKTDNTKSVQRTCAVGSSQDEREGAQTAEAWARRGGGAQAVLSYSVPNLYGVSWQLQQFSNIDRAEQRGSFN